MIHFADDSEMCRTVHMACGIVIQPVASAGQPHVFRGPHMPFIHPVEYTFVESLVTCEACRAAMPPAPPATPGWREDLIQRLARHAPEHLRTPVMFAGGPEHPARVAHVLYPTDRALPVGVPLALLPPLPPSGPWVVAVYRCRCHDHVGVVVPMGTTMKEIPGHGAHASER